MNVGVLGTGTVGVTLGSALVGHGHMVCIGSRSTPHDRAREWEESQGPSARAGTFAEAAAFGEVVFNCTAGVHSLEALDAAGADALAGKVLIDVANPLDFTGGFPPRLAVADDDSLAEQIQLAFPLTQVVKALNTVTASVMVNPAALAEPTDLFIAGDDVGAKARVTDLLVELGWRRDRVRDLGGLAAARATERYLLLWLSLMGALGSGAFNVRVVAADGQP